MTSPIEALIDAACTTWHCVMDGPEGGRCRWTTDSADRYEQHVDDHLRGDVGIVYDNCQTCRAPIRLTRAAVLRVHGPPNRRCPGGGNVGRFVLRCRGELEP